MVCVCDGASAVDRGLEDEECFDETPAKRPRAGDVKGGSARKKVSLSEMWGRCGRTDTSGGENNQISVPEQYY